MGWLGPRPLAASALGINLTFAFSLMCLGHRDGVFAADGNRAWRQAEVRKGRSADFPPIVLDRRYADGAAVADPLERRADHSRTRAGTGTRARRDLVHARLHVVHVSVPAVPGDAQLRLRAGAAGHRAGHQPRCDHPQLPARLRPDLRSFRACRLGPVRRWPRQLHRVDGPGDPRSPSSSSPTGNSAASICSAASGGRIGRAIESCGSSAFRSALQWPSKAVCSAPRPISWA